MSSGVVVPSSWQDWIAWAGLVLPLAAFAWAAVTHVVNQRQIQRHKEYEKLMDLIARYNNASGEEPLFTQLAAAFELRNYPKYKDVILSIQKYQNEKVAALEDLSHEPIRLAKRELVQSKLNETVESLNANLLAKLFFAFRR